MRPPRRPRRCLPPSPSPATLTLRLAAPRSLGTFAPFGPAACSRRLRLRESGPTVPFWQRSASLIRAAVTRRIAFARRQDTCRSPGRRLPRLRHHLLHLLPRRASSRRDLIAPKVRHPLQDPLRSSELNFALPTRRLRHVIGPAGPAGAEGRAFACLGAARECSTPSAARRCLRPGMIAALAARGQHRCRPDARPRCSDPCAWFRARRQLSSSASQISEWTKSRRYRRTRKGRLFETVDIDECRLHAWKHASHPALYRCCRQYPLPDARSIKKILDLAVFHEGDTRFREGSVDN